MSLVMVVIGALVVVLAVVVFAVAGVGRTRRARFAFEDREDYLRLRIERRLSSDETTLVTMRALREAVRLKLGSGYGRLVIDVRRVSFADSSSFWLLIGGLGPALLSDAFRVAVVCRRRTEAGAQFRQTAVVDAFGSEAEALAFLRSAQAGRSLILDPGWIESLLLAKDREEPASRRSA